ncbi:MAG: flagellar FliJ family protein [Planctomycetes bacterium]|nr:flagellar FliJ family protein [Planctomycetota bacterium]MCB9884052.1 flagellar FliJ family protein [Planctomycetota bacterium]
MRRFRFRLQPLVRLRSQLERNARRELATAMAAVNQVEQQQAAAAQGLRECADQAAGADAVGMLARSLEVGLRRHKWRLDKQLAVAERGLTKAQGDYAQRARDLKVLQQLRDKRRDEWRLEVQRAEQAELDELSRLQRGIQVGGED